MFNELPNNLKKTQQKVDNLFEEVADSDIQSQKKKQKYGHAVNKSLKHINKLLTTADTLLKKSQHSGQRMKKILKEINGFRLNSMNSLRNCKNSHNSVQKAHES